MLALYVTTPGAAGAAASESTLLRVLGDSLGPRLDFHSEYIDFPRFSEPDYSGALVQFLRYKYQQLPPDVVIATTEAARRFAERYRAELFPAASIVFVERIRSAAARETNSTGVSATLDLTATLDLALSLQPSLAQVFFISGVSEFDRPYDRLAREQFGRLASPLTFTYLTGKTLAELQQLLAQLPPQSMVYFLSLGEDGAGARFISTDAADRLSRVTSAPFYSWHNVAIGHGVVGGRLFSNEIVAAKAAELTLRILRGEKADDIPIATLDPTITVVDWRELRRWNIDEARVPAGATVIFREPSLWDQYRGYMLGALALIALQTALIASLTLQGSRRRRAERKMREQQCLLEASHRQISELVGRLIAAQETERSRIARDLHDDVIQRIAALSIAMSRLKRKLLGGADDESVVASLSAIQRDVATLAEEVRHVSHDLHPNLLQHTGLIPALNMLSAQFGKQHAIAVTCNAVAQITSIEPETALCLYRVTQQALHNIGKHAQARRVAVQVTRTLDGLQLLIADDGKGFDLANARAAAPGLGLVSIGERVRLLRGTVDIETQPGAGTIVVVRIPYSEVVPPADSPSRPAQA